jgi:hypothetical protein
MLLLLLLLLLPISIYSTFLHQLLFLQNLDKVGRQIMSRSESAGRTGGLGGGGKQLQSFVSDWSFLVCYHCC